MRAVLSSFSIVATALSLCLLAASGCSDSQDVPSSAVPAELPPAIVETPSEPPVAEVATAETEPVGAETPPPADAAAVTPTSPESLPPDVTAYQAPFPDRVDLFVPPKRQGGAETQGESEEAVSLLGFVHLDRQQVVLSINGEVWPIEQGGAKHGVEVISIQPPSVVLQRGRQRWQATLNN